MLYASGPWVSNRQIRFFRRVNQNVKETVQSRFSPAKSISDAPLAFSTLIPSYTSQIPLRPAGDLVYERPWEQLGDLASCVVNLVDSCCILNSTIIALPPDVGRFATGSRIGIMRCYNMEVCGHKSSQTCLCPRDLLDEPCGLGVDPPNHILGGIFSHLGKCRLQHLEQDVEFNNSGIVRMLHRRLEMIVDSVLDVTG